jgi:hypothetical protein
MDLQELGLGVWTTLIWLRTGTGGRLLWMFDWLIDFILFHRSYRCGNCHQT